MECEDCNKLEATNIIYDSKKEGWFIVCDNCIDSDDLVVPNYLILKLKG